MQHLPTSHRLCEGRNLYLRRTNPMDAALLFERAFGNPEFMRLYRLNDVP
jgi:hypothetical protein